MPQAGRGNGPDSGLFRRGAGWPDRRERPRGECAWSQSDILLGQAELVQHRVQQPGADFLAAGFDGGPPGTVVKRGVRALPARLVEHDGDLARPAQPPDAIDEFAASHPTLSRTKMS